MLGTKTPTFNTANVDPCLLELREALWRFKNTAKGISFSPGKFPSALRPLLNEAICVALRAFKPTLSEPLPAGLCSALTTFLPFNASALEKLLLKKILRPLKESIETAELTNLYEMWPQLVLKRLSEEGSVTGVVEGKPGKLFPYFNVLETPPEEASPAKKPRLKFSEEMRQVIYDILRAECDVNNIAMTIEYAISKGEASGEASPMIDVSMIDRTPYKPLTELHIRKAVYSKLVSLVAIPNILSTTDLSKEFAAIKKKHEKRIAKAASEAVFSEEAIETLLKPKVVVVPVVATEPVTQATDAAAETNDQVASQPKDELANLFANDNAMEM